MNYLVCHMHYHQKKIMDTSPPDRIKVTKVTKINLINDKGAAIPPVNIISIDTTSGGSLSSDQISETKKFIYIN